MHHAVSGRSFIAIHILTFCLFFSIIEDDGGTLSPLLPATIAVTAVFAREAESTMPHDPFNFNRSAVSTNPPPADKRWGEQATDLESTRAMVAAVDARDPYTRAHSVSVAAYAVAIGRRMGLSAEAVESLRKAALLHDVGKIGVPDAILTKPGPLTPDEFAAVKRHPEIAIEILGHLSVLADQLPLILHHHERYDGRGYPSGLVGEGIPIGARILAVADALDTMLSQRTYKPAYNVDQVRAELIACSGRQFDPAVVQATLALLDE